MKPRAKIDHRLPHQLKFMVEVVAKINAQDARTYINSILYNETYTFIKNAGLENLIKDKFEKVFGMEWTTSLLDAEVTEDTKDQETTHENTEVEDPLVQKLKGNDS